MRAFGYILVVALVVSVHAARLAPRGLGLSKCCSKGGTTSPVHHQSPPSSHSSAPTSHASPPPVQHPPHHWPLLMSPPSLSGSSSRSSSGFSTSGTGPIFSPQPVPQREGKAPVVAHSPSSSASSSSPRRPGTSDSKAGPSGTKNVARGIVHSCCGGKSSHSSTASSSSASPQQHALQTARPSRPFHSPASSPPRPVQVEYSPAHSVSSGRWPSGTSVGGSSRHSGSPTTSTQTSSIGSYSSGAYPGNSPPRLHSTSSSSDSSRSPPIAWTLRARPSTPPDKGKAVAGPSGTKESKSTRPSPDSSPERKSHSEAGPSGHKRR